MYPKAASDSEMCQNQCQHVVTQPLATPTEQQLLLVPVVNILRAPVCVPACAALPAVAVPAGTLLSSPHSRGEEFVSALQAWFDTGRLFPPCHHLKAEQGCTALGLCPLSPPLAPGLPRWLQHPTVLLATLRPLKKIRNQILK